ncbi:MAG: YdcF family protein [Hyphomonadaceae bacterium]|nr:YdcF family protein [Hyphomonadaceae bacterium]
MRVLAIWVAILAVLAFVAGFWEFADDVRADPAPPPRADAIVALTGGSNERLAAGVRLLKEHRGARLLISGVNRIVTDHELYAVLNVDDELGRCCIDIGRTADDTLGNAAETADWARRRRYTSLILVTDDYHMPRSQTELQLALPDVEIYPYPVRTRWTDPALWRRDIGAAGRLGAEYLKYLVIRGREGLINLGRGAPHEDDKAKS